MKQQIAELERAGAEAVAEASSLIQLEEIRVRYLGRRGLLTEILRGLAQVAPEERKSLGQAANEAKDRLSDAIGQHKAELEARESEAGAIREPVDLSLPGRRPPHGHAHPTMAVIDEIVQIFIELGYQVASGPDIETEYYNFDALNTPADHPARDLHDTFFVKPGVVLRTHTSPVQIRVMEKVKPPIAIVVPGRAYRVDADASHSPMFWQIEGLVVDEGISLADLKGVLMHFVHRFFGPKVKCRFRPHFFPFTEPSAELDIECSVCSGSGCRVCKHSGWLEALGCGMVHPEIFRNVGIDYEKYTGFAFGMGPDRITMLRHSINSIHHLFENDLRFLEQF
jgi:phenylalanyl-tRNA synthetase alpha chain